MRTIISGVALLLFGCSAQFTLPDVGMPQASNSRADPQLQYDCLSCKAHMDFLRRSESHIRSWNVVLNIAAAAGTALSGAFGIAAGISTSNAKYAWAALSAVAAGSSLVTIGVKVWYYTNDHKYVRIKADVLDGLLATGAHAELDGKCRKIIHDDNLPVPDTDQRNQVERELRTRLWSPSTATTSPPAATPPAATPPAATPPATTPPATTPPAATPLAATPPAATPPAAAVDGGQER